MKKWILIIVGIILIGIIGIGIKINSDLNDVAEAFKSEHALNEPNLNILSESISPDKKYKYYEYQFDKGGLGYSRVFWSVIENAENINDLKKGLIPSGYKIIKWNERSELILKKWKPYYESKTTYELNNKTEFNGIKINITE
ncbi:hypothetical protein [uncultured Winogradskyella sp.]|uniref:hypothetical protein n=1 Tax=uncultured Winogradskyella sp. TaxID=395353 RepID=UPI0030DAF825|tara:strand:- start:52 stop:477 length:426 start_codon:yes stop_codon:yes gene_type:complete